MECLRGLALAPQRFPIDATRKGILQRRRAAFRPQCEEGCPCSGNLTECDAFLGSVGGRARDSRFCASAASMLIGMAFGTVLALPCALVAEQFPGMAVAMSDSTDAALGPAAAGPRG